jgi:hypothetical protein
MRVEERRRRFSASPRAAGRDGADLGRAGGAAPSRPCSTMAASAASIRSALKSPRSPSPLERSDDARIVEQHRAGVVDDGDLIRVAPDVEPGFAAWSRS